MKVEIRRYDGDFMLRGYCFDRSFGYFSYFLREGEILTGRINKLVTIESGRSEVDDFLLEMFNINFDSFFIRSYSVDCDQERLPYIKEP